MGAALVLATGLAACGDDGDDGATSGPAGSSERGTIRIGLITSLSGDLTELGTPWRDSAQLAVDQVNEAGGVTVDGEEHDLELVVKDDRSDPQAAVAGAVELVEDQGARFLVAPLLSNIAPPVVDYAVPRGVLTLTGAAVDSLLVDGGAEGDYDLLFKTQVGEAARGAMSARAITELLPETEDLAIIVPSHATGETIARSARAAAEEFGLSIVASEVFSPGATDLATPLTKVVRSGPDTVVMCCTAAELSAVVAQGTQLDPTVGYAAGTYPMSIPLGGDDGTPLTAPSLHIGLPAIHETLPDGTVKTHGDSMAAYAEAYEASFGRTPPAAASNGLYIYDFIGMLAQAIGTAGTTEDTEAVATALLATEYDGAIGAITFGEDHIARHGIQACLVADAEVGECIDLPWETVEP